MRLEPADVVPPVGPPPDVDAAVRRALSERTDLAEARKQIENDDTNILLAKNQTLPDLRLQATYLTNGLGGTRIIREGGFPGTIVGQRVDVVRLRRSARSSRPISRRGRSASR